MQDNQGNPSDPVSSGSAPDPAAPLDKAATPWLTAIKDAQTYFKYWQDKCDAIDKLYADLKKKAEAGKEREFQMFWANLEVLKPSIYSRPPVPVVVPRFKDQKPIPREASEMLERSLIVSFETQDVNALMLLVRDDMVTNARGAAWVRYDTTGAGEQVIYEHLDRADFLHEPARKWQEVGWVAKRAWLTLNQGLRRFGDVFTSVKLKTRKELTGDKDDAGGNNYQGEKKGEVWEIWSKSKNIVAWVADGLPDVLDMQQPFLQLEGFFPCPRPAYATLERRRLIPVPDFVYYKDQLEEINELTARISALSEALRMKGLIPGGAGELSEALETALKQTDNNALLIPVPNFAALGGTALKDSIVWLPIEEVATTIKELVLLRRQLIDDVYQVIGLSDIMRGSTQPEETAMAQQLKSQYGSIRIRDRQAELVRFARDLTRIGGEIMAENFQPETLLAMSQMELPTAQDIQGQVQQITQAAQAAAADPQAQMLAQQNPDQVNQLKQQVQGRVQELQQMVTVDQVVQLLREQRLRPFILEIETDSTIQPDEDAEKEKRTEFLTALGATLQQLFPLVQAQPAAAPFAVEILKFAVAPFRAGRALEQAIEQFGETVKGAAQAAMTNQQPTPEQIKLQTEQQIAQLKLETEKQKGAIDLQMKQADLQIKQQEAGLKSQEFAQKTHQSAIEHQQEMVQSNASHQQVMTQTGQKAALAAKTNQMKMQQQAQQTRVSNGR